jgi:hypothetical protein
MSVKSVIFIQLDSTFLKRNLNIKYI